MEPRKYLRGDTEDEGRFRIQELAAAGRTFQVVRCLDTERGGAPVCAKAPLYQSYEDEGAREVRREAAEFEIDVLQSELEGFPEAVDLLELARDDTGTDPVVVIGWTDGTPAYDFVEKRPREVLDSESLLELVRKVAERISELHDGGYLFRDLDPRHVLVDGKCRLEGVVGTSNITELEAAPIRPAADYVDAPYVAPEARQERSGETMRPAADVYGLAALLSFLLTGEEPTSAVESPLTGRAYEVLEHIEPAGLRHLVAAGLQPVAKNRISLETFVERARMDRLPSDGESLLDSGDSIRSLPPPWSGAQPPGQNRAAQSSLSDGPLISVDRPGTSSPTEFPDDTELSGVKSEPVREFMGERDGVGDDPDSDEEEDSIRRRGDGAPAREVSMVQENVPSDSTTESSEETVTSLPDLTDLSLGTRLLLGAGIPLAVIASVVAAGLAGLY